MTSTNRSLGPRAISKIRRGMRVLSTTSLPPPLGTFRAAAAGQLYASQRAIRRRRFGFQTTATALRASIGKGPELTILLANQRSGTSLFCSLFEQLPDSGSIYEALNPAKSRLALVPANAAEIVVYLKRAAAGEGCSRVLSKAFYENLDGRADIDELATLVPQSTFVVLWRRDLLAAYVSLLLARQTGTWHHRTDGPDAATGSDGPQRMLPDQVHVDIEAFRSYREQAAADTDRAVQMLRHARNLEVVCYEDLARSPEAVMNNFAKSAFGPVELPSEYTLWFRKPDRDLSEVVSNWDVLLDALDDGERYHPDPIPSS